MIKVLIECLDYVNIFVIPDSEEKTVKEWFNKAKDIPECLKDNLKIFIEEDIEIKTSYTPPVITNDLFISRLDIKETI